MEIVCYYFYDFYRPKQYLRDFEELRSAGVDSIIIDFYEEETLYWHEKDLQKALKLAHENGLKVYCGFCRFGNAFAGTRWVPSFFACRNPQTHVVDREGKRRGLCCVNNEEFRNWYFRTTEELLSRFDVDGVQFDEPKGIDLVCYCTTCQSMGASTDEEDLRRLRSESIVRFLGDGCYSVKKINRESRTMLVAMRGDRHLFEPMAAIKQLDVFGSDPYWLYLHEDLSFLRSESQFIMEITQRYNKGAQIWVQNFAIPKNKEKEVQEAFDIVASFRPSQLCAFHDIMQNEDADAVWELTKEAFLQIKKVYA